MTSVKYYSRWIKEAGRGHVTAFCSWGFCILYTIFTMPGLRMDTEYNYFGIGSESLFKICIGLGIFVAAAEFWYLYQPSKLDFYYSLPVKKGTVFWCRYVHGLFHVFFPLTFGLVVLAFYEGSVDKRFLQYAGAYTFRSVLAFLAVFLLFYHITITAFLAGGRVISAFLLVGMAVYAGPVMLYGIGEVYAAAFFSSYYRIPAFGKLEELLTPGALAGKLAGIAVFGREEVFAYVPEGRVILAAVLWILISGLLMAYLQKTCE